MNDHCKERPRGKPCGRFATYEMAPSTLRAEPQWEPVCTAHMRQRVKSLGIALVKVIPQVRGYKA